MRVLLLLFFTTVTPELFAQKVDITQLEMQAYRTRVAMMQAPNDDQRKELNKQLYLDIQEILAHPKVLKHDFDSLKTVMAVLSNSKSKFKLFNWNLAKDRGTHKYYCEAIYWPKRKSRYTYSFQDKSSKLKKRLAYRELSPAEWYGALYYQLINTGSKKEPQFTLLGWDGNNTRTNKKIIEPVKIDDNGGLKMGYATFIVGDSVLSRMVYEYTDEAYMSLKYDKGSNKILMDHLSPSEPALEGIYEFYGPDMSYDAFKQKDGYWLLQEDVDVRGETKGEYKLPDLAPVIDR